MSWYNDISENTFIDATQEIIGGGGVSTIISEIQNTEDLVITEETPNSGEDTTIGNVVLPAVFNEETGTFDLYIRNTNSGGKIYFTTRGDDEKVKIENGLLYVYYDYDFLNAPLIPGGWTDIVNYLVATRQLNNANSAGIVTVGGAAAQANALAGSALGAATAANTLATANSTAISGILTTNQVLIGRINGLTISTRSWRTVPQTGTGSMNNIRNQISNFSDSHISALQNASRILVNSNRAISFYQKINFGTTLILAIVGGGVLGSALAILGFIRDSIQKEELNAEITQMLRDLEQDAANYDKTTIDVLHKNGLQIVSSTNGNFTTPGLYDVSINNDETFISFEISGNPLVATIIKVHGGGNGHSVGDVISINKSEIGGTTGTLDINVTSLITELEAVENFVEEKVNQAINIENRQRRRQNIPNTSSYSTDGFNIVNTPITEPDFGEITNEPTINLKIDTSQFQYDGTGNLQIKSSILAPSIATDPLQFVTDPNSGNLQLINYDKIAEIGDDTVGSETGLYQYVLNKIEETLGDQETYDANGNVVVPATNIYQEINNIYELVMVGDQTFQNNNYYNFLS